MITVRKSEDRGAAHHGWLDARHSFSFASYYDPDHMGFGPLRVINEDRIAGGGGFATHPHENMEIVTYVMAGALEHKDSMGNHGVIRAGDIQYMSAGTGVQHSEFNASPTEEAHLYQIWIEPNAKGHAPRYSQRSVNQNNGNSALKLFVSGDGRDGSTQIHQDADVYTAKVAVGDEIRHDLGPNRLAWVQVAQGEIEVNGKALSLSDGAAIEDEAQLHIKALSDSEFLLFDMAKHS